MAPVIKSAHTLSFAQCHSQRAFAVKLAACYNAGMAFLLALIFIGFFALIIYLPWQGIQTLLALVWACMGLSVLWAIVGGFFG